MTNLQDHPAPLASRFEVITGLEPYVAEHLPTLLKPVEESWQPSDYLPDFGRPEWAAHVQELRARAEGLSDELLVVLVGDMITEEALPTYQTWLNRLEGVTDVTGSSDSAWARWGRGWTAEENRHGDLLNKYLTLTGRVDMRAVEVTIQNLIARGFDPRTENDPYLGFIYTSFQERATKISHRNVATLALRAGEETLHKICGIIAGDEARHEKAYKLFMARIFEVDPAEAVRAFAAMMKRRIIMPAVLMKDTSDEDIFGAFSRVAQRLGVYTARDYAEIVGDLVEYWRIPSLTGLSGPAAQAQDYLAGLSARFLALAGRITGGPPARFSWVYGRQVG
jgi:acyl-[acyl-carrier-protein] desaturase